MKTEQLQQALEEKNIEMEESKRRKLINQI